MIGLSQGEMETPCLESHIVLSGRINITFHRVIAYSRERPTTLQRKVAR